MPATPSVINPVFVVGAGRSGTSLVQSMLASHSRLAFPPETSFIRRYVVRGRLVRLYRSGGWPAVDRVVTSDPRLQRLSLDVPRLIRASAESQLSDVDVYDAIQVAIGERAGKVRVGDKDPRLIEYLPVLKVRWPGAYIVHVVRDPRDVLVSRQNAAWSASRSLLRNVVATAVQARLGFEWGQRLFGQRYHEVVYERLLENPEQELRQLCAALDLPYETAMLQFAAAARDLTSESEISWKKETFGPLLRDNHGKWRTALPAVATGVIERVCRTTIDRIGYSQATGQGGVAPQDRLRSTLLVRAGTVLTRAYVRYRRHATRVSVARSGAHVAFASAGAAAGGFDGAVHYVGEARIIASRGRQILESHDDGSSWRQLAVLPPSRRSMIAGGSRALQRMLRAHVHHVIPIGIERLVVFDGGSVCTIDQSAGGAQRAWRTRGSRPLKVAVSGQALYYGDYHGNPQRDPVVVWKSTDGGSHWVPVWRFEATRHVHGVFVDPFTGWIWVTTGDDDHECNIWVTRDDFGTLELVAGGTQQTRVVQLLFTEGYVYFGSDAPKEHNFIYRMARWSSAIECLQRVDGPVFSGTICGNVLLFATVCEPSLANRVRAAVVWASDDGERWWRFKRYRKDWWPMRLMQYGQVLFPRTSGFQRDLWMTPLATKGDGRSERWTPPFALTSDDSELVRSRPASGAARAADARSRVI